MMAVERRPLHGPLGQHTFTLDDEIASAGLRRAPDVPGARPERTFDARAYARCLTGRFDPHAAYRTGEQSGVVDVALAVQLCALGAEVTCAADEDGGGVVADQW